MNPCAAEVRARQPLVDLRLSSAPKCGIACSQCGRDLFYALDPSQDRIEPVENSPAPLGRWRADPPLAPVIKRAWLNAQHSGCRFSIQDAELILEPANPLGSITGQRSIWHSHLRASVQKRSAGALKRSHAAGPLQKSARNSFSCALRWGLDRPGPGCSFACRTSRAFRRAVRSPEEALHFFW